MLDELIQQQAAGFLLSLARVGTVTGFSVFQLMPGMPAAAKVTLSLAIAYLMAPLAANDPTRLSVGVLLSEMLLGSALGWLSSLLIDWVSMAAQFISLQAGFSYASTIDPMSQADSGLLPAMGRGVALLLLFSSGVDRLLIHTLILSYRFFPVGSPRNPALDPSLAAAFLRDLFELATRLALPVVLVLLLTDVALAILGRLHQQLQLPSLAFPLKLMLWPLATLIALPILPKLMELSQSKYLHMVERLLAK